MTARRLFFRDRPSRIRVARLAALLPNWHQYCTFRYSVLRVAGGDVTVMAGKKRISSIDGLAGEVLVHAGQTARNRRSEFATAREEITRLEHREYGRSLRDRLSPSEVREIVREASAKAWP